MSSLTMLSSVQESQPGAESHLCTCSHTPTSPRRPPAVNNTMLLGLKQTNKLHGTTACMWSLWSPWSTRWLLLLPMTESGLHTFVVKLTVTATSSVKVSILEWKVISDNGVHCSLTADWSTWWAR